MQCPQCKRYRHDGDCEPVFDEPDKLELLQADAEMALERYQAALTKSHASHKEAAE